MGIIWLKKVFRPIYVPLIEKIRYVSLQYHYPIRVMSSRQTMKYIKKYNCSISRYGDGEFHLMSNGEDLGFQSYSASLSENLKQIISDSNSRLLICLPRCIVSTAHMKSSSARYWRTWSLGNYARINIYQHIMRCGKQNYLFGDAMLTRPYMDWKSKRRAGKIFAGLKSIWEGRDVLIVEGDQTRLGIGNDLFSGAKSIKRILAPALDAYASYEHIKKTVLQQYNGELVIIALGPTATVLAADLSKYNIWALDIGHIDIEYEWYLRNAQKKEAISGKYTNEVYEGHVFSNCDDSEYHRQIVARIGC